MFWTLATLILLAAGLIVCWPMLRGDSDWKGAGIALLILVPAASLLLYRGVGSPESLNAAASAPPADADIDSLTDSLRERLTESPESLDGWVLLGKTYKTMQRYPEALEALETAHSLAPDDPVVMVEMVEAQLYASGNPRFTGEMTGLLERAVAMSPSLQKGLWLLGIASAQAGDDRAAVDYWQRLASQLEPGSPVAQSVREQISQAESRLGIEPAPDEPAPEAAWPGLSLQITADDGLMESSGELPAEAALFVIVYPPGPRVGPPLGVRRIADPEFPLRLTLQDEDSMMPERLISAQQQVQVQARLSASGRANAISGDWQSAPVDVAIDHEEPIALNLDQKVE